MSSYSYVTGICPNGERLRFEGWVYERYIYWILSDPFLRAQLDRCTKFVIDY